MPPASSFWQRKDVIANTSPEGCGEAGLPPAPVPDFVRQPDVAAASEVGAEVGAGSGSGSGAVSAGHIGALPFGHLVEDLVG